MKRKSNDLTTQTLLDFDLDESSSDSDFRIEDHDDDSDDCSVNSKGSKNNDSNEDSDESDSEDESDSDASATQGKAKKLKVSSDDKSPQPTSITKVLDTALASNIHEKVNIKLLVKAICCACLGDRSDDINEIVECDGCGVTVHEGCYGVSDSASISSTVSSCSTEPWFCEACKAGVTDPHCELCPNKGGIFKETDVGKWVHLVCALYVPGVAFGEVDQLSAVTLFEMPYNKWGAKTCSLCEDARFSRSGVCIGCDAGMCKTYFHVTCAQSAGFLSEAHSEEVDQADPFYAHCKIHSDKTLVKHRKRNFNALKLKMVNRKLEAEQNKSEKSSLEQLRIERKLKKHKIKYLANKETRNEPWVPTQKMPRLLNTSASACKKLISKSELMGIDTAAMEFQEAQMAALTDVRKKWHISPAFSVEFIGYYLDRTVRLKEIKQNLEEQLQSNKVLLEDQQRLRIKYDETIVVNQNLSDKNKEIKSEIEKLHTYIKTLCPNKPLPAIEQIGKPIIVNGIIAPPVIPPPLPAVVPAVAEVVEKVEPLLSDVPSISPTTVISTIVPSINLAPTPPLVPTRTMSVPTAAALKMGVGFPLNNLIAPGTRDDTGRVLSTQCPTNNSNKSNDELLNECGICKRCCDQHLLAKCDTCHLYYHLGCLNPPLTRHPKKSKLYGWQCSECDKSDDSEPDITLPKVPRRSRTRYSKDGTIVPVDPELHQEFLLNGSSNACSGNTSATESLSTSLEKSDNSIKKTKKHSTKNKSDSNKKVCKMLDVDNSPVALNNSVATENNPNDMTTMPVETVTAAIPAATTPTIVADAAAILNSMENSLNLTVASTNNEDVVPIINNTNDSMKMTLYKSNEHINMNNVDHPVVKTKSNKKSRKEKKLQQLEAEATTSGVGTSSVGNLITSTTKNSTYYIEPNYQTANPSVATNNYNDAPFLSKNSQFTSEIITEANPNADMKLMSENGEELNNHHKQNRKQKRKDKHRNRHLSSEENAERSPTKEHKRKRKRKNHDMEKPITFSDDQPHPRIKIKLKAIPTSEVLSNPMKNFYYVPADSNDLPPARPMEICHSVSNDSTEEMLTSPISQPAVQLNDILATSPTLNPTTPTLNVVKSPVTPGKITKNSRRSRNSILITPKKIAKLSPAKELPEVKCDVCQIAGKPQDLVKCDECRKSYHYHTCLEPPLKKTPKRRGYSWHCADCDPTDVENN